MELNNLLKLDLKEHCLFCLKPTTLQNVSEEENKLIQLIFQQSADGRFNSFQRFFWKVLSGVCLNGGRVGEKVGGNLLVCRKCIIILKEIKRLHSHLEITQMLLVEKVKALQMLIQNTGDHGAMKDLGGGSLSESELEMLKAFQKKVITHDKRKLTIPLVFLDRLDNVNVEGMRIFPKSMAMTTTDDCSGDGFDFEDFATEESSPLSPSSFELKPPMTSAQEKASDIRQEVGLRDERKQKRRGNKRRHTDWDSEEDAANLTEDMYESEEEYRPPRHYRKKLPDNTKTSAAVANSSPPQESNLGEIKEIKRKKSTLTLFKERLPRVISEHSQICDLCYKEVLNDEILNHLQGHVMDYAVACVNPECGRVFSCKVKLNLHIIDTELCNNYAKANNISVTLDCSLCKFKCRSLERFAKHLKGHELKVMDKSLSCPIPDCTRKFASSSSVDLHIAYHRLQVKSTKKNKRSRRTELPNVVSEHSQICDLCYEEVPNSQISSHLQSHVQDYVVACVNPKCPRVFSCKVKWRLHIISREACRNYAKRKGIPVELKCSICEFKTNQSDRLRGHLSVHELAVMDKQFSCPIPNCLEKFTLKDSVDLHISYHDLAPPSSEQECSVCQYMILVTKMSEHLMEAHKVLEPVKCKQCPFLFAKKEDQIEHLYDKHRNEYGAVCDICEDGIRICYPNHFRKHYLNVHHIGTEDTTTLICEHCSREFSTYKALSVHKGHVHSTMEERNTNNGENRKRNTFPCKMCPQETIFKSKDLLLTHNIACHGAALLKCNACDRLFSSAVKLRHHIKSLHQKRQASGFKKFICKLSGCDKTFKTSSTLHNHQQNQHPQSTGEIFQCDQCYKDYSTEAKLKHHQSSAHAEAVHMCETCGESFKTVHILKRHKLIHSEERPHICPICGQAFRTKSVMGRHIKSHEEKGYTFKPNGPMKQNRKRVAPK